ncbi:MAG: hypothetical protein KDD70_18805, partial [Bdellovibrionales bacterium]|nr:hypothetical protein [Bdellovibrionales bacterium]
MDVPQYWIQAEAIETSREGKKVTAHCWGWSSNSESEARERAEERARNVARRIVSGEPLKHSYDYGGERPIREERIREEPFGLITRTGYGSLVLNCPRVMFIDVDEESKGGGIVSFFRSLFGGGARSKKEYPEVERLREFQKANKRWSFRVYKTHSGFRYIAINGEQDPLSEEVRRVMEAVGADPLYIKLCTTQKCFRARVSPKPWRCGSFSPPVRFPFATDHQKSAFEKWLDK